MSVSAWINVAQLGSHVTNKTLSALFNHGRHHPSQERPAHVVQTRIAQS